MDRQNQNNRGIETVGNDNRTEMGAQNQEHRIRKTIEIGQYQ